MKKEEFEKLLSFLKLTLDEKSKKAMSPGDKLAVFLLFASGIFSDRFKFIFINFRYDYELHCCYNELWRFDCAKSN